MKRFISRSLTELEKENVIKDYLELNLSLRQIGIKHGVESSTIAYFLKKNGIKIRSVKESRVLREQKIKDLKVNRLTFIKPDPEPGKYNWICACDCGKIKSIDFHNVLNRTVKSCGCLKEELLPPINYKHNMAYSTIYQAWHGMLQRCLNPKTIGYKNYGGRGIKVCERWLKFENFYEDMGDRPFKRATIDRINNDGDYCKENCKWTSYKEQARNKRTNYLITYKGKTLPLATWAEELGIKPTTLDYRVKTWSSIERAFMEKIHYKINKYDI